MHRQIFRTVITLFMLSAPAIAGYAQRQDEALKLLDLDIADADSLVEYFRSRQADPDRAVVLPGFNPTAQITAEEQKWADEAMEHQFYVHSGYQPSFHYGDDIDWQYWPVRDNELRWQLHRMKWWVPLGRAYRCSGDERYAEEWTREYLDWIRKNPLGDYGPEGDRDMLSADNMYWAWRPLETSHRIEDQIRQFILFLPSEHFDGDFISEFLINYHRHCEHIMSHFSAQGNHLLFQAQRLLYASIFFKEFKDAPRWRERAIDILNDEIQRQVYSDGVHYELDPHYHLECINIFFNALQMCDANGMRDVFPQSYIDTVHSMIRVVYNWSYPDYTRPQFSDYHGQAGMLPLYRAWAKVFPQDEMIQYLATQGASGSVPKYLSKAFPVGGFYCLRNSWSSDATVMVLKAGPKGQWHCQPDNCTFEYWRAGRSFFPDSGCYVYGGDDAVNAERAWFRQSRVHNTMTLDERNIEVEDSHLISWTDTDECTMMTVENPSYPGFVHTRTVRFDKSKGSVVIIDSASGEAGGEVELHYSLLPCSPVEDLGAMSVSTTFEDGNNITLHIKAPSGATMVPQEGRVSYTYRQSEPRPSYEVKAHKAPGQTLVFTTTITPCR